MKPMLRPWSLAVLACVLLSACAPDSGGEASSTAAPSAAPPAEPAPAPGTPVAELAPLPGAAAVPTLTEKTTISLQTTAGEVTIEVYPQAAPNAAARFVELVRTGFYDGTPVSRVVAGFVAQFGINWREPHRSWQQRPFVDDPTLFALERGTLAFAKAGPNTNSTQVFINFRENNQLADPRFNFTVFGKVTGGMDIVDSFAQVGDPSGGLDQAQLWSDGGTYLESLPMKPTMIERAVVVE